MTATRTSNRLARSAPQPKPPEPVPTPFLWRLMTMLAVYGFFFGFLWLLAAPALLR
ncbi:MAG: hypothetical protein ACFB21_03265 [Opitutales bacterium]